MAQWAATCEVSGLKNKLSFEPKFNEKNIEMFNCVDRHRPPKPVKDKGMLFLIRHSERCDRVRDPIERAKIEYKYDMPITSKGEAIAFKTGKFMQTQLAKIRKAKSHSPEAKIVLVSSPYIRCIQTSKMIVKALGIENIDSSTIFIEDAIQE
jgi:broad specificity phosphatase PhoE